MLCICVASVLGFVFWFIVGLLVYVCLLGSLLVCMDVSCALSCVCVGLLVALLVSLGLLIYSCCELTAGLIMLLLVLFDC